MGKTDYMRGLKENILVGRLIPAGTGLSYHSQRRRQNDLDINVAEQVSAADVEAALSEALQEVEEKPRAVDLDQALSDALNAVDAQHDSDKENVA
jgi:hypothetical protein